MPLPEKALIDQIRKLAGPYQRRPASGSFRQGARLAQSAISTGIGDDCTVLQLLPGQELLVTTDFSLEGIHFRRDWHPPESAGHRCLARGLSDIAAMGGEPIAAFLSLALPRELPQPWVRRFIRGVISLAKKYGITLAGGDTSESRSGILADIIVVGTAPKGKSVLRSTALPGDRIFISGELGGLGGGPTSNDGQAEKEAQSPGLSPPLLSRASHRTRTHSPSEGHCLGNDRYQRRPLH